MVAYGARGCSQLMSALTPYRPVICELIGWVHELGLQRPEDVMALVHRLWLKYDVSNTLSNDLVLYFEEVVFGEAGHPDCQVAVPQNGAMADLVAVEDDLEKQVDAMLAIEDDAHHTCQRMREQNDVDEFGQTHDQRMYVFD